MGSTDRLLNRASASPAAGTVPETISERKSDSEIARLVHAAASGDRAAWEALVGRYSGLVWSVTRAHRLDEVTAADVAQTTWLRLVEHLGRLRDPEKVGGWLAATARNECLRTLRLSQRQVLTDADIEPGDAMPPALDAALLAEERDAAVWRAYATLNARCQALLRMLTADPPPAYEEIGAALEMPIGSIGPTRARCLSRLRDAMEQAGITAEAADS